MTRAIITPELTKRAGLCKSIFNALRAQQSYEQKLLDLGFNWEYGEGATGKFLETNKDVLIESIYHLFGLERTSHQVQTNIYGQPLPCTLDILYPDDNNIDFTITEEDFIEALYKAIDDTELSVLMIHTWVMKDSVAREKLNERLIPTSINPKVGAKNLLISHGIMRGE